MTIRSKQWYTKASKLPNSLAKISIGCLRLFLHRQQDHRPDDRWKSKQVAGRRRKKGFKGKKPPGSVPWSAHESEPPERSNTGRNPLGFSKFQISLDRISSREVRAYPFSPTTIAGRLLRDVARHTLGVAPVRARP